MQPDYQRQSGFSTLAAIGAFVGLGVVFLIVFFMAGSTSRPTTTTTNKPASDDKATDTDTATAAKEPPFIRIPENSAIYNSEKYGFMFAYPDSFGTLTQGSTAGIDALLFKAESALADNKPIGAAGAVLNGKFGVYIYKRSDFKIVAKRPDITVGPTKTGNDTTWKIVSRGTTVQDISVGDAYQVKSIRSQTGIPVFDFSLNDGTSLLGRWVFESGENYVLIAMPSINKTDGSALLNADSAPYTVIGNNIARTVRLPANSTSSTTKETNSTTTKTTTAN